MPDLCCSFCGKTQAKVRVLIVSPNRQHRICNGCVGVYADICRNVQLTGSLRVGDKVRLVRLPGVRDHGEFKTRTILKKCMGKVFRIQGFQSDWVDLHVGHVIGKKGYLEMISVPADCLALVGARRRRSRKRPGRPIVLPMART